MANTKGKIIIGAGIAVVGGITAMLVIRAVRRRKISKSIFKQLDDATDIGSIVNAQEAHKYTKALDPKFWQKKTGTPLPSRLIPDRVARDRAKAIYSAIGFIDDDESAILKEVKKAETQGQLSQVAYAYENAPLNYGNLGDDLEKALKGTWFEKERLKELNAYIASLPY